MRATIYVAKDIREKFVQNKPLLEMIKGTGSLTLAEESKDKLWGTGVSLRDSIIYFELGKSWLVIQNID